MREEHVIFLIHGAIFAFSMIHRSYSANSPVTFQTVRNSLEFPGQDDCSSPNGALGRCIPLLNCTSLKAILDTEFNRERIKFLQLSTCKLVGEDPYVCCTDVMVMESNSLHDPIENHRNIGLLPTKCGEAFTIPDRIVGGKDASLGAYPWMALLSFKDASGSKFACGGSLISKRYVLTAAHCVTGLPAGFKLDSVRLGELNLSTSVDCESGICSEPAQDIKIERVIQHEKYHLDNKHENDIALLRLQTEVQLNDFVGPICLPRGKYLHHELASSRTVTVAGWGRLNWQLTNNADVLQYAVIPVLKNNTCSEIYKSFGMYEGSRFCAGGEKGRDSCNGDSGGPIMDVGKGEHKIYQYGIVSLGPFNCGGQIPGLYTNVTFYMTWILNNIGS